MCHELGESSNHDLSQMKHELEVSFNTPKISDDICSRCLDIPGAKSSSRDEAFKILADLTHEEISPPLAQADRLESSLDQRHQCMFLIIAR